MKQIKVLHRFRDKNNYSHIYGEGEVAAFDDARAANIVERGLGEYVTAKAETKKHEPVASAAAPADGGKVAEGAKKESEEKKDGTDANQEGTEHKPEGEDKEPAGEGAGEKTDDDESESASLIAADPAPAPAEQKAETAKIQEPTAKKETKASKSSGTRKGGKKAE